MINGRGSSFNWTADNGTGSGDLVTPGLNTEGSWTQLFSSGEVAHDAFGLLLVVNNGSTSAAARVALMDIGIDPAGGTSYATIIPDICCGGASNLFSGGLCYFFPIRIPAGASVAARARSNVATAYNLRAKLWGKPTRPENCLVGAYAETLGTPSGNLGVSVTPGDSAAKGSWVSLGTTVKPLWYWQLTTQIDNAASNQRHYQWDLAYGTAGNKVMIFEDYMTQTPATSESWASGGIQALINAYREVPAGSEIFVRAACNGVTDTGLSVLAIGIGG